MFEQLPQRAPFDRDPCEARQVSGYRMILQLLNAAITRAPEFNRSGQVGLPINAILDWPLGTGAGAAAFLHPKVNSQVRAILDEWSRFLRSKDSLCVLTEDAQRGWFGKDAQAAMPNFDEEYPPGDQAIVRSARTNSGHPSVQHPDPRADRHRDVSCAARARPSSAPASSSGQRRRARARAQRRTVLCGLSISRIRNGARPAAAAAPRRPPALELRRRAASRALPHPRNPN
jgi:hypothetical protein